MTDDPSRRSNAATPSGSSKTEPSDRAVAAGKAVDEWWEMRPRETGAAVPHLSGDVPAKENPAWHGLSEEALRKKARGREAQHSLLKNPISDFDRRSGELESLIRFRGDADEIAEKIGEKRKSFWPFVGAAFLVVAAIGSVAIPIYLNKLEMERLERELAANPPVRRATASTILDEIGVTVDDPQPESESPAADKPSPAELEAEDQRRFADLIERADDAASSGDLKAIQAAVEQTIETAPDRPDVLLLVAASLGTASSAIPDSSRAALRKVVRPLYEKAADAAAGVPALLQRCGDFFAANGELDRARELYERAVELHPSDSLAAEKKAFLVLQESGTGEAIAALKGMAERQPSNKAIRANLARLLLADKRAGEALPYIEEVRRANPEDGTMLLRHLRALIELGLWQAALDEIAEVSEGLRATPAVRFFRAQALFRIGSREEAMEEFRSLSKLDPPGGPELTPGTFAYTYGVAAMLAGDPALALSLFETATAQNPEGLPPAWNNLAWLLIEQGGDVDKAVAAAKRAVSLDPSVGSFSDTLARALLAAGDSKGALERARAAIRLSGEAAEGEMFETLGDALSRLGEKKPAREAYLKAISKGVPKPDAVRAKISALGIEE